MIRLAVAVLAALMSTASLGETIPPLHCESLAGSRVDLPADLHGRSAVLVIGFSRDAQDAVRDWGRRLGAEYGASPSVSYYELAMLAGAPRVMRGFILRAMKKDVSERGKAHFLVVTEDEAEWRRVAHYDRADMAYVMVVDGAGAVRWTTSGPLTEGAYAEMKKRLVP